MSGSLLPAYLNIVQFGKKVSRCNTIPSTHGDMIVLKLSTKYISFFSKKMGTRDRFHILVQGAMEGSDMVSSYRSSSRHLEY